MKTFLLVTFAVVAIAAKASGCTCGVENIQSRIINGREAQRFRYPWMVSVNGCGGSLINDRYILTVGKCFRDKPEARSLTVILGAHTNTERWFGGFGQRKLLVESYRVHENWDPEQKRWDNDLALVKLRYPVVFGGKLSPVCLPNFHKYSNLFVAGWGWQNSNNQLVQVTSLHETEVDEVDNSTCYNNYWGHFFTPETQICAGTQNGICGDDGSPLSTRHNGHVYQVGIALFANAKCGVGGMKIPDVYERITAHLDWIEKHTSDANWCKAPDVPAFTRKDTELSPGRGWNWPRIPSLALPPGPPALALPSNVCRCGQEKVRTRIINGHEVQKDRYPWMVSLLTKQPTGNGYASCGGALINDRYIMTAAHCLNAKNVPSDIIAVLGAHENRERWGTEKQEKLEIESIMIHEQYGDSLGSLRNDITLLKLKKPVDIVNKWNPICLPNFSRQDNLFVKGWGGQNENNKIVAAKVLHEVEMDEVDNTTCTQKWWGARFVPEKHICAGTQNISCYGDSGGPVSTRRDGYVYQVAIVSWGEGGCGIEGAKKPGVFERVTSDLAWIEERTRDANWCTAPEAPEFTKKRTATVDGRPATNQPSQRLPGNNNFGPGGGGGGGSFGELPKPLLPEVPEQKLPTFPGRQSNTCTCGVENIQGRIINGREAQRNRYPWMVSVNGCGGSLINDRYILTVGKCFRSKPEASSLTVILGAHTNTERWFGGFGQEKLEVESYRVHENWDPERRRWDNDIALVKLKRPLDLNGKWKPICLADFHKYSNLFVAGWGWQNSNNRHTAAQTLYETEVDEVDNSTCVNKYWGRWFVPENQICAGTQTGICEDDGGPLATRQNGHVYQVGVSVFQNGKCGIGVAKTPDVYERITAHLKWIERHTSDASWCTAPNVPEFTTRRTFGTGYNNGGFNPNTPSPGNPAGFLPSNPNFGPG